MFKIISYEKYEKLMGELEELRSFALEGKGLVVVTSEMLGNNFKVGITPEERYADSAKYLRTLTWEWQKAEFAKGLAREVEAGKLLLEGGDRVKKKGPAPKGKKC